MRRLLVLCSALAVVFAACGSDPPTPLELVQRASAATTEANTARMHMEMETGQAGVPKLEFDGAFDFDRQRLRFTLDGEKLGLPGFDGKLDAIMDVADTPVQYMRLPGLEDELDGKHWMKIDVGGALREVCPELDFEALLSAQSGDPTSGLQFLDGATRVEVVGQDTVRGAETTRYHVVVNVLEAAESGPEAARGTMRKLAKLYTNPEQEMDVWLDDDDRVRRYEQSIDNASVKLPDCLNNPETAGMFRTGTMHFVYELYDFGADVNVELPKANDVVDLQELMEDAA